MQIKYTKEFEYRGRCVTITALSNFRPSDDTNRNTYTLHATLGNNECSIAIYLSNYTCPPTAEQVATFEQDVRNILDEKFTVEHLKQKEVLSSMGFVLDDSHYDFKFYEQWDK